jgi:hypothetical protein
MEARPPASHAGELGVGGDGAEQHDEGADHVAEQPRQRLVHRHAERTCHVTEDRVNGMIGHIGMYSH